MDILVMDCGCPSGAECSWVADMSGHRRSTRWMKIVRRLMLAGFCLIFSIGCQLSVPANDSEQSHTTETVWTVLADYVSAGEIADSTKLELIVRHLRVQGAIDDNSVDRFYQTFPGIKDQQRPITPEDSKLLRGM